jgi:hypothetical protein
MDDARAGGHPVHLAGTDGEVVAQVVAVQDLALEEIGAGGQADVRMRADVTPWPGRKSAGPMWSRKMKGPTIRRWAKGSTRPTSRPSPRSLRRPSKTISIMAEFS